MPKTTQRPVAGVWIHPADDDYLEQVTMRVSETRTGPNPCTAWDTKEDPVDGHEPLTYQFVHVDGSHSIFFSHRMEVGHWSPATVMAQGRWDVIDGHTETARDLMRDFFTVGGWYYQGLQG